MSSSILEFSILKCFDIKFRPPLVPKVIQVDWWFPIRNWVKYNTNGDSRGNHGVSTCGGIFKDYLGIFLGAFSAKLGIFTSFQAKLHGIMILIDCANMRKWRSFWLESDSILSIREFTNVNIISWHLLTKWKNPLHTICSFIFKITHIFRG